MSRRPSVPAPVQRDPDLFAASIPSSTCPVRVPPDQVAAYVEALEERCTTLWRYIQGYDCSCDPVVRILAAELGITVAHAPESYERPAAD